MGLIMAKRKKGSKLQRRGTAPKHAKSRKVSKAAKATKGTTKPKRAPVKKVARKGRLPVGPAVETAEVIEQPAPGVTEVEENTGK